MTGGLIGAALHHSGLTALAGAAVIGAASSGWFGFSCAQDRQTAAAAEQSLRQVEIANLNLQTGVERLRDETQKKVEQLQAERDRLRAQVGRIELQLASLPLQRGQAQPRQPQTANPSQGTGRTAAVAPAAAPAASPRRPPQPVSHAPALTKNFTAPRWAPDFFTGESEKFRPKRTPTAGFRKESERTHWREHAAGRQRYMGSSAPEGACSCAPNAGAGS